MEPTPEQKLEDGKLLTASETRVMAGKYILYFLATMSIIWSTYSIVTSLCT